MPGTVFHKNICPMVVGTPYVIGLNLTFITYHTRKSVRKCFCTYPVTQDCVLGYCSDFPLKCRNRRNVRKFHSCFVIAPLYRAFLQCHVQGIKELPHFIADTASPFVVSASAVYECLHSALCEFLLPYIQCSHCDFFIIFRVKLFKELFCRQTGGFKVLDDLSLIVCFL